MQSSDDPYSDKFLYSQALDTCACFNLRKTTRVVTQHFDEILQPTGLRSTQLVILMASAVNPSSSIARLARELVMDSSTLNRNLRPLEKKGMLQTDSSSDGRRRVVSLTVKGKEAISRAMPFWKKAQDILVEKFGHEKWELLIGDLSHVLDNARS